MAPLIQPGAPSMRFKVENSMSPSKGKSAQPSAQWTQQMLRDGFKALSENRLKAAGECCRKVLSAQPELVEGHFLVGLVARQMKDRRTAISAFGSVTKLQPDHAAAYAQLAHIFMQSGQPNRGYEALQKAVEFEAGDPMVQSLIGQVYFMLGEQNTAFQWHSKALSLQPENPTFNVNYANSLVFLGKLDEAKAALAIALKLQPGGPQAHWILSNISKATDTQHIETLQQLLKRENLAPQGRSFLSYALGKELEDLQQWDAAFEALSGGASARRSVVEYDEASEAAMFKAMEHTFTREWMEQAAGGLDDPSPIFIVGQPRSGTTLVERVITSHSPVHWPGNCSSLVLPSGECLITGNSGAIRLIWCAVARNSILSSWVSCIFICPKKCAVNCRDLSTSCHPTTRIFR